MSGVEGEGGRHRDGRGIVVREASYDGDNDGENMAPDYNARDRLFPSLLGEGLTVPL